MEPDWKRLEDALLRGNGTDRHNALITIKDGIIGSNRQKGALISNGLVPVILQLCALKEDDDDKFNALIILGSLAKGSQEQVETLVKQFDVVPVLIKEISNENNTSKCVEICLLTLRSIYEKPYAPSSSFFSDECSLTYFLSLASAESSLTTQICVTSILVAICQNYYDQIRLLHAGTIHVLARMITLSNNDIQIAALRCLCSMCYLNRSVTDNVCVTSYQGKSLPDILNLKLSRLFIPEIQLTAAKCLTYIYRSGTLLSSDPRILHKTLPTLARLCSDNLDEKTRTYAAETLAYLIEVDSELQRTAAICNHLLKSLSQLFNFNSPQCKEAALNCFGSLSANDESIRKRVIEVTGLMDTIMDGLNRSNTSLRMAAIRCLHSLSRSVQQLRTTFQDHAIWEPLLHVFTSQPSNDVLIGVTSVICNLLLEFSPSKEPLVNAGIIGKLCELCDHNDIALRLNSIWALMNLSFQAEQRSKTDIIDTLGTKRILELLCDSDATVVMKTLGLLRNLMSKTHHIDYIMSAYSVQILEAVNMLLDSCHSPDIKEQMLCVVGSIAADEKYGDRIINDEKIMKTIEKFLFHTEQKLQAGALYVVYNIVNRADYWLKEKCMTELNIIKNVSELNKSTFRSKKPREDYIHRILTDIIVHCKNFCPEILNN